MSRDYTFEFARAAMHDGKVFDPEDKIHISEVTLMAERKRGAHPGTGRPISGLLNHAQCISHPEVDVTPIGIAPPGAPVVKAAATDEPSVVQARLDAAMKAAEADTDEGPDDEPEEDATPEAPARTVKKAAKKSTKKR